MEFPTEAAYPMSYDETTSLLSEMQRQASEIIDASRDDEEGYEVNMTDDFGTFEIAATYTWDRSLNESCDRNNPRQMLKNRPKHHQRVRGRPNIPANSNCMDAPLSPHIDANSDAPQLFHVDTTSPLSTVDPPVCNEPAEESHTSGDDSIMLNLSDLEDVVGHELDTVKRLLYKVKRERDTYKRSNLTLQKSLSEAIASRGKLETEHREALDVILATADDEKKRLKAELKQSNESKRKLKKLVSEMINEKTKMEELIKKNEHQSNDAGTKADASQGNDAKLDDVRTQHFSALSSAITDLEAKFEADMEEVIKEKDEEIEREKKSHDMIVKAMEEENKFIREELDTANESLTKLMEEHAMCGERNKEEAARLCLDFEKKQSKMEADLLIYSKTIDELETKLQTECMHTQALISEVATKKDELVSKNAEIVSLERKLSDCNAAYTREYDRMKAHLTKMCTLVESSSADRDRAREETKKLKTEIDRQNAEHKAEIARLKQKLEDSAREMVQHCTTRTGSGESLEEIVSLDIKKSNALDNGKAMDHGGKSGLLDHLKAVIQERDELAAQVARLSAATNSLNPELSASEDTTSLEEQAFKKSISSFMIDKSAESLIPELSNKKVQPSLVKTDNSTLLEGLDLAYLTINLESSTADTAAIEKERDSLASKVKILENSLNEKNKQLLALEDKLSLNEEQEIVGTVEQDLCEYTMARMNNRNETGGDTEIIKQERNQLDNEVKRLKALLKEAKVECSEGIVTSCRSLDKKAHVDRSSNWEKEIKVHQSPIGEVKEEMVRSEEKLMHQEEEMSEYNVKSCRCESLERERDNLIAELTTLKAVIEGPDKESAAVKLGEDLSSLKLEHRVEVKLLKKDHAATKTKVKLLKQELQKIGADQEEMIKAYDIERKSNAELSSSLEEMVHLLEKERALHTEQIESFRNKLDTLKSKFSKMRKKRVPIDAAYKATRILLDRYEAYSIVQEKLSSKQLKTDDECLERSMIEYVSEIEEIKTVLAGKEIEINFLKEECNKAKSRAAELELRINLSMEGSIDDSTEAVLAKKRAEIESLKNELNTAKSLYDELNQTYCDDIKKTREELNIEMTKLHQAHSDSIQAFSDACNKYESDIATAKAQVSEKETEIESLTQQLDDTKVELGKVKSHLEIHVLQESETIESLEQQLKNEKQLKETSVAQLEALEEELREVKSEVEEKEAEIEFLTQQLNDTKNGLDELESQLEFHVQKDGETIDGLEKQVVDERELRETAIAKMETLNSVIDDLKTKLQTAETKLETIDYERSDVLKHTSEISEKFEREMKTAQGEIDELNAKLARCNDELVSSRYEQSQLLNQVTAKQEDLKTKQDEIDELKTKLADCEENISKLQNECSQLLKANEVADCAQNRYEQEAKTYCDEIELLKKQMKAADVKSKQELKSEVDRLKSEFNEVIQAFEKELVDTCESNANALHEKSEEIDALKKKLSESMESISSLDLQIVELTNKNVEVTQQLDRNMALEVDLANVRMQLADAQSAESALSELKRQHASLVESYDALKQENLEVSNALKQAESSKHELKSKLHETLLSVEENLKAYNSIRASHSSLQEECQVLRDDSSSLHALVSNLNSEKEELMNDVDKQTEQNRMLCAVKSSLEQEIENYKSHQSSLEQLLAKVRDEKENLLAELEASKENISAMKNEMNSMVSEISLKQQQIDSLQEQSKTANRHLDEMVTYCDKLKTEFAGTSASLRNELEEQTESMNGVINSLKNQLHVTESEKEENRKIYEKDIELQQTEVETLKRKHAEALNDLDSLSDLVSGLKDALEEEKMNSQVLRSQFRESESERKAMLSQNIKLEEELESKLASETLMQERIHHLEVELTDLRPMPDKLTEMMKSESIMRERIHVLESQVLELNDLREKLASTQQTAATMRERIHGLETQAKNFQIEYKNAVKRKEEESSKLRVVLQECREKLNRMLEENEKLKHDNAESVGSLKSMLNEAIRSRADTDAALQESLQLLEQQKRVDIKRKGELSKLEQTVEILKSKERYLESYVSSLKNQINRGSR
ncbi:hypothetical protein HJC23_003063 [Cyclotella cryptica]|uniref:Uncharacterized protein n=1 Tax=Cyclotella cryptica TaxID=29204 RepID=A0ABD3PYL8_9STRA|eukprot:CCRYP_010242-RA/>CCRYP_010242-RA protein AED:0.00 eAED:0.00 QI:141/1/1/1/1/1/3/108/2050